MLTLPTPSSPTRGLLRKRRVALWLIITLLCLYDLHRLPHFSDVGRHAGADFHGYWACGRVFLAGGNPYDATEVAPLERSLGWLDSPPLVIWGPPLTFVLMWPFLLLPFAASRVAWFLFSLILLMFTADLFWKWNQGPVTLRWVAWLTVLLFVPSALALNVGQFSPLLLAGVAGFLSATNRRRDLLAGVSLLPLVAKPHILLPFLFLVTLWTWHKRRWGIPAGIVAALGISVALSLLLNPRSYGWYLNGIRSNYGPHIWQTPTLATVFRTLVPTYSLFGHYLAPCAGMLITAVLWYRWRRQFSWHHYVVPISLLSVITAAYGWISDFVVLLPAALIITIRFSKSPQQQIICFTGLVATQALAAVQLFVANNYFALTWLSPVLAILYWVSNAKESKTRSSHEPSGI